MLMGNIDENTYETSTAATDEEESNQNSNSNTNTNSSTVDEQQNETNIVFNIDTYAENNNNHPKPKQKRKLGNDTPKMVDYKLNEHTLQLLAILQQICKNSMNYNNNVKYSTIKLLNTPFFEFEHKYPFLCMNFIQNMNNNQNNNNCSELFDYPSEILENKL
jgi:hypothetical protein